MLFRSQLRDPQLTGGAVVVSVLEGLPAEKASIQAGDVVVGVDGRPVHSAADLIRALERSGDAPLIRIDLRRGGKPMQLDVRRPAVRSDAGAANRVYAVAGRASRLSV